MSEPTGSPAIHAVQEKDSMINLAIVENRQGDVLMVRRAKKETGNGEATLEWAFPGGRQRIGETREQSIAYDVLHETGYAVTATRQIHIRMHPQFPVCAVYHLCKLEKEELAVNPSEPKEIAEIRWVKPQEIPTLITTNLDPAVAQALRIS